MFWDNWFKQAKTGLASPRPLAGKRARVSVDKSTQALGTSGAFFILAPADPLDTWRTYELNDQTLSRMSPADLIELLVDVSPEVSRALWDFLRFCNPGYEALALRPGSEEQDARGQAALQAMIDRLEELYGSFDVVLGRLFLAGFMRGAFVSELVLDERGREFIDLATPDPYSIRFRQIDDELRGPVWQPGQYQGSQWISLDIPTLRYIPIDPLPGSPYGRAPVAPALFSAIFLIGLLHDLRRVIAQQGYPRLDLEVDMEALAQSMPADLESDTAKTAEWVQAAINEIKTVYESLQPDDAYIHTSVVQVNRPVGTVDASSLGAVDTIISALEGMLIRALKTMPLLFGVNEAATETHANRQWEIHVAGIKSLQHLTENLLEYMFGQAIRAQGLRTEVKFRFAELRASEMLRDAQTETLQIANAREKYDAGWISQDEAAEEVTGHAADSPTPRTGVGTVGPLLDDGDGMERTLLAEVQQARRELAKVFTASKNGRTA